ncbi:MAG: DedA family protein [Candidatus Nanopelagicaceae bacterium]|nr:DedA family protein [Candidatus Nanopelagicaceae bacterium]
MSQWIQTVAEWLVANNLEVPLFMLLILLAFAEAAAFVGFVLPGETSLLIGGVLAYQKVWPLWLFLLSAIIGAIAGDSVGYEVGKHFGPRIETSRMGRLVGAKRWRLAQHIFDKYHGGAIFFGRAQALLRALVPALAGMNRVPYWTFLKWNAAGGIVFSTVVVLLGYEFSNQLVKLEHVLKYWAIGFLTAVITIIIYLKRKLERIIEPDLGKE